MNKINGLVFLESNKLDAIPFTTSEIIAEFAGVKHHAIQQLVTKHEADFKEFGVVAFEMRAVKENGARGVKHSKIYHLNEEQATLLMTYLKNTPKVRVFKKELVRQFFAMRTELLQRQALRMELKPIRRELTDVIQEMDDGTWSYKKYIDLAYRSALGKSAAQLRKERDAPKKAHAVDYMTSDEISAITRRQSQIAVLLEMGLNYQKIKEIVSNPAMPKILGKKEPRQV